MADAPDWPHYQLGPKDSIFAVGVISIQYARLEFAMGQLFSIVIGISPAMTAALLQRLNNKSRIATVHLALPGCGLAPNAIELVSYFFDGFKVLAENRNLLMHSNLIAGIADEIALFKPRRSDGQPILCRVTTEELRQIADSMKTYFDYGFHLAAMIKPQAGDFVYDSWPDKPAPPILLEYSTPAKPVTRLRDL